MQPGRFTKIEDKLTLHIRERKPNGQLLGILIDDQRDPKERATILAEQGDIVKNERGLFLVLENGSVQRHETGQRDPALVLFNSYGFDLSSLTNGTQNVQYSVRERYLWELYDPTRTDTHVRRPAGSDPRRIPRPHHRPALPARLRRADLRLSRRAAHDAAEPHHVAARRDQRASARCAASGFVGMIAGVHTPIALLLPYLALARGIRARIFRDFARRHHRAAGLHRQCDHGDHGAHGAAHRRPDGAIAMIAGTLSRYFGMRFLTAVLAVFAGTLVLTAMIDFLELMRRTGDLKDVSAFFVAKITFFRVPFITERVMPFAVLVGAMFCYLNLSRRLELVVARAAGISAWQFIAPAIIIAWLIGVADDDRLQSDLGELARAIDAPRSRAVRPRQRISQSPAAGSGCASAARTARRSSTPNRAGSRACNWAA